jgi:hypothetical protein
MTESTDSRIKLTGLAFLSPRLQLLKWLADGDDHIAKWIAYDLLHDRSARFMGGLLEFSMLAIFPAFGLLEILTQLYEWIDGNILLRYGRNTPGIFDHLWQIVFIANFGIARWLLGLIIFTLVFLAFRPGWLLRKISPGNDGLRRMAMDPHSVFLSISKAQFISVVLPWLIGMIILWVLGTGNILVRNHVAEIVYLEPPTFQLPLYVHKIISFMNWTAAAIAAGSTAIYSSIKYEGLWNSLMNFMMFVILFCMIEVLAHYFLDKTGWFFQGTTELYTLAGMLFNTAFSVYLARVGVREALLPTA